MDNLMNNDLIITNNKKQILKELEKSKRLVNIKIMTCSEFLSSFFGTTDEKALYYLVKNHNYSYEVANMYLNNFMYIDDIYKELSENNLIKYEPLFKSSLKRIVVENIKLDPYVEKINMCQNYMNTKI